MIGLQISGNGYRPQTAAPSGGTAKADAVPHQAPQERADAPTLIEQMREAREKAEQAREKFQLPKNSLRYGDAPIEAYSRLARARTAAQVSSAAGFARRKISQLKAAKRQDPDHAHQIQGAIAQLQKAVIRAGKKRTDLAREALAEKRWKKLAEEEQVRRARRLRQQLQSRRAMRALRESGYLREAEVDHRLRAQMDVEAVKLREQFQSVSEGAASAQDSVIARYTAQAAGLEAPPASPVISAQA